MACVQILDTTQMPLKMNHKIANSILCIMFIQMDDVSNTFFRSFHKYNIYKSPFHLLQENQRTYEIYMNNEHCTQYHSHYYNYFLNVLWIKNRFGISWKCNHIKDAYLNVYEITKNDPKTFWVIYGKGWKNRK